MIILKRCELFFKDFNIETRTKKSLYFFIVSLKGTESKKKRTDKFMILVKKETRERRRNP